MRYQGDIDSQKHRKFFASPVRRVVYANGRGPRYAKFFRCRVGSLFLALSS